MSEVKDFSKYSYDQAKHTLFAIKEEIADLKNENLKNKKLISLEKKCYTKEKDEQIFNLKVEIEKRTTTYKSLVGNTEFTSYVIRQKRAVLKKEIKVLKKMLKIAKMNLDSNVENQAFDIIRNGLEKTTKKELSSLIKNNKTTKEINVQKITDLEKKIDENKQKIKSIKVEKSADVRQLRRQIRKEFLYNNLSDEYKEIKKLDKTKGDYTVKKAELLESYNDKKGRILKFQANSKSYWFMLIAVFVEIIYTIFMLNNMYVNYMVFPALILNLIFILSLFLSAMKVKIYSSFWTKFNYVFCGYLVLRVFLVIPFVCKDIDAVYEGDKLISDAISYAELRRNLIICSVVMLLFVLIAAVNSTQKIKNRNIFLVKKEA